MCVQLYVDYEKEKGRPILCSYTHEGEVASKASIRLEHSTRRRGWSGPRCGHLTPEQTQFHRTGGWLVFGAGLDGTERLAPPGLYPQPAQPTQPVASRYTD